MNLEQKLVYLRDTRNIPVTNPYNDEKLSIAFFEDSDIDRIEIMMDLVESGKLSRGDYVSIRLGLLIFNIPEHSTDIYLDCEFSIFEGGTIYIRNIKDLKIREFTIDEFNTI